MKRVLVITYYWPPSGGAGVQRWLKFVKYLRSFGWEPVVYCPQDPEYPETDLTLAGDVPPGTIVLRQPIWEPYDLYKKLIGRKPHEKINAAFLSEKKRNRFLEGLSVWIRGNFFIPDARRFWIRPSVRFLINYLEDHPVDAIASTGPPHSMHLIAHRISRAARLPWLADFRDPWTSIDFYSELRLTGWADRLHRKLEKSVLAGADAVSVVSRGMADDFSRIQPRTYEVITNGYDADDTVSGAVAPDPKFTLAHIGTLAGSRNPVVLWQALQELLPGHPDLASDLEIRLIGKVDYSVTESIESCGLSGFIRKTDYLPHSEVMRIQKQSRVLLLLINRTPNARMILTGKFFEYLAAGRPILCIGPSDGDAAQILAETGAGHICGYDDVERMKELLLDFHKKFLEGSLDMESTGTEAFSRRALTEKLALVLDRITEARNTGRAANP